MFIYWCCVNVKEQDQADLSLQGQLLFLVLFWFVFLSSLSLHLALIWLSLLGADLNIRCPFYIKVFSIFFRP